MGEANTHLNLVKEPLYLNNQEKKNCNKHFEARIIIDDLTAGLVGERDCRPNITRRFDKSLTSPASKCDLGAEARAVGAVYLRLEQY